MHSRLLLILAVLTTLSACGLAEELVMPVDDSTPAKKTAYTLIYYIHGDSDYLYHDSTGNPRQADEEILADAKMLAELSNTGEIFIFHQKSKPLIGGLSGMLYHYRFGNREGVYPYKPGAKGDAFLATESALYQNLKVSETSDNHRSFFLFYGHEIPNMAHSGYHATHDNLEVSISSFAEGLRNFLNDDADRFELILLSSCSNGEPEMARAVQPHSRAMIASPQNLHLSYIRPLPFILLEPKPQIPADELAEKLAEVSFRQLSRTIQTTVTISYYQLDQASHYLDELSDKARVHHSRASGRPAADKTDCALILPGFEESQYTAGVRIWYKPSRFGRAAGATHSGWGCTP